MNQNVPNFGSFTEREANTTDQRAARVAGSIPERHDLLTCVRRVPGDGQKQS